MTSLAAWRRQSQWIGGLAEWTLGATAYLSVAFTWKLPEARDRATWYQSLGYAVIAGGPALYAKFPGYLDGVATVRPAFPDAIRHQNPAATMASRGCDETCYFCDVPKVEGAFTYYPDFPVRPILCDNNLSAIPAKYQDFIVARYVAADVPLLDANSGFEPKSFDGACFERWRRVNRGPWRFGYDVAGERETVRRVMTMLRTAGVAPKNIRPYVLIGNEPVDICLGRIREVIEWGGEPHVQAFIKRNALEKTPHVSAAMGWTPKLLGDMARWANRRVWRYARFEEYRGPVKSAAERFDRQQGLFV
jgi:hypothetical protein